jgi:hypothetical protein
VHIVASVRDVGAGATVEAAAVDDQRLVAIFERRPLDLVLIEVQLGTRSAIRSSSSRRSASERSTSRSLSGAQGRTVDLLLPQTGGFEGLYEILTPLEAGDPAFAQGPAVRLLIDEFSLASPAANVPADGGNHDVPTVEKLV